MNDISLGQLSNILKFIIEFGGLLGTIVIAVDKILSKQLQPLNNKIEKLDMNQCKNFLVSFLADVEHGKELDEVEVKRAYDVYDHYKIDLHGNSYIKDKWDKLMK